MPVKQIFIALFCLLCLIYLTFTSLVGFFQRQLAFQLILEVSLVCQSLYRN